MSSRGSWAVYAAALWALIFAVLHVVWATGWYIGLHQELARKAFQQRWFLIYDIVVAALCALAVWVALALLQPRGTRPPRRLAGGLVSCGAAVLALRGGAGALQNGYLVLAGRTIPAVLWIWDVWFCLGAVLFGLTAWRFWRGEPDVAQR